MLDLLDVQSVIPTALIGGIVIAVIFTVIALIIILVVGLYFYFSFAWMTIAKKLRFKHIWLAWIPFARTGMILYLGKLPWGLAFLYLVPIIGWLALFILEIIAKWHIFEKRNYPGWFSLSSLFFIMPQFGLFLYAVILGFVAWKDNKR